MFSPSFKPFSKNTSPFLPPFANGLGIPNQGLKFLSLDGETDSIGLSVTDYDSVDPMLQDIFFIDATTLRPTADAVALALDSIYLNIETMAGDASRGVALYKTGTSETVLTRAYRYFGKTYGPLATGSASAESTRIATYETGSMLELVGIDLSEYIGNKIKITSDSKSAYGWIGAAGGLTLSAEKIVNGSFTNWADPTIPDSFTKYGTHNATNYVEQSPVGQCRIVSDGTFVGIDSGEIVDAGKIVKSTMGATVVAGSLNLILGLAVNVPVEATGNTDVYRTVLGSLAYAPKVARRSSPTDVSIDNLSVKEVTDVPTTGAKIYTESSLTTQSWVATNEIDPNHVDGVTFEVYQ